MDFTQILTFVGGITAICACISGVAVAGSWLFKGFKNMRKPHTELAEKVETLGAQHPHYEKCLKNDQEEIVELKEGQKLLFSICLRLANIKNDEQDLSNIRDDIEEHLVKRSLAYRGEKRRRSSHDEFDERYY